MLLIQQSSDTPIRPKDVESETIFSRVFNTRESDIAAYWIVRYCQAQRSWTPFEFERFVRFCSAHDPRFTKIREYLLEGVAELVVNGFVQTSERKVVLSTLFVARCYGAAPVLGFPRRRRPYVKPSKARSRYERLLSDAEIV